MCCVEDEDIGDEVGWTKGGGRRVVKHEDLSEQLPLTFVSQLSFLLLGGLPIRVLVVVGALLQFVEVLGIAFPGDDEKRSTEFRTEKFRSGLLLLLDD